jgi:hypothetical protein
MEDPRTDDQPELTSAAIEPEKAAEQQKEPEKGIRDQLRGRQSEEQSAADPLQRFSCQDYEQVQ